MWTTARDDRTLSIGEYADLQEPDYVRSELVRGRVVREPRPGGRHALVQTELAWRLRSYVGEHRLGAVFTDVGVVLSSDPPTVRGPDVAFMSTARLPETVGAGFLERTPDLVIEVVSPSNRPADLHEKVVEYLRAEARLVWMVDPRARTVTVYRALRDIEVLVDSDVLDGGDVLPGFSVPVAELFPG